jgi:transposase
MRLKVVELHKSGNGYKKIAQRLKTAISSIKFKATRDVNNQPGRGRVSLLTPHTVRRIVRVAKKSSIITTGELQIVVGSCGQKVSKSTIRHNST